MGNQQTHAGEIDTGRLPKAVRTGLRLNQMFVDWTMLMLQQTGLAHDLQQGTARVLSMAADAVSASQAHAGGLLELMGRSIRVKAGLLQMASAAGQAASLPESQSRWLDFWAAAFHLAHSNADALARINGTALDSWMRLVKNGR